MNRMILKPTLAIVALAILAVTLAACTASPTIEEQGPEEKIPGTACTMDYNPVCGENGITYGNPCMATVEGMAYTPGECPAPSAAASACNPDEDAYPSQTGPACVPRYDEARISSWLTCTTRIECGERRCALVTHTTDGQEFLTHVFRCVPDEYATYLVHTTGLTTLDENGRESTVIA